MNAALIWDPSFVTYKFRSDHPFNPKRLELTVSLIEEMGLVAPPSFHIVKPCMATDEELMLAHDAEYIAAVKRLGSQKTSPFPRSSIVPGAAARRRRGARSSAPDRHVQAG